MVIDPSLQYERRLKYMERHGGWEVFKMVYWGIYVFIIGLILLVFSVSAPGSVLDPYKFFGWALTLFAIFFILYGFAISLHLKLMRRYA